MNCPKCGKEMVETETKKKGVFVLKHKEARGDCGVTFIPVDSRKKAVTDGGNGQRAEKEKTGSEYADAVKESKQQRGADSSKRRAKQHERKESKQHQQQPASSDNSRPNSGGENYQQWLRRNFGI